MCGRYTLRNDALGAIAQSLGAEFSRASSRYNIAPGQQAPVIRQRDRQYDCSEMRWGLVPHWSSTADTQYSTINARVETIASKPTYRDAFKRQRCLVAADGYYEWQRQEAKKQPFYVHRDGQAFVFAGIWDHWGGDSAEAFDSFSIVTTTAAESMRAIHPRMPVILPPSAWTAWLAPDTAPAKLADVLARPETSLTSYPVSTRVNNPRVESPSLIEPLSKSAG